MSPSLTRYMFRRLAQVLPILLGILAVNFVLIHLAPGDPIYLLAGDSGDAAYYAAMRAKYGLDQPIVNQFVLYLWNAAQGQFGYSFAYTRPVFEVIGARVPPTLLLMGSSLVLSISIGLWLGAVAARRANSSVDHVISVGTLIGYGMPAFWLAQLLVLVFAVRLGWFPIQGMVDLRAAYQGAPLVLDILHHLFLPMLTLTLLHLALVTRLTRTGIRQEQGEDYVRTARAKGLAENQVQQRHAFRNALLPVVTTVGLQIGMLFMGAVLVEIIFAWPGLGRLLYDATLNRDYPLLMGIFLSVSLCVIFANLVTDVIYTFLDPRVKFT
ncbi:MAG: ABC transporter permease [Chloroflexi bacterium]|nr:ABC transporter permease [Chloroflexota bacterium]